MKTLHLTNAWHEKSGGTATFYRALIGEANRREQPIRLIVPAAGNSVEEVGKFGKIYHIAAPPSPLNSKYRTMYPSRFLAPGSRLQTILAAEHPDLVEISDKYTLNYLAALLRARLACGIDYRPLVVGLSQERMKDNVRAYLGSFPFSDEFCSFYMKWLYFPFFDHHIANSEYTAAELRSVADGHLVPRGTWVRSMGVDLRHFSPKRRTPELRRRLLENFGAMEDAVLLLYVGRLVPEKNLDLLFEVLPHLAGRRRDYRLLVLGDGIERERWERRTASTSPGRVLFMGHIVDKDVLANIYANADVFVHPNPREPFGIAPLEAMASGLPLVAPNQGGITSYANAENAWTVPANAESFAVAIQEVMTDRAVAGYKVQKALTTANDYRWEKVASSFLDLYDKLMCECRGTNQSGARFYSSNAKPVKAALTRGAARLAVTTFRAWSNLGAQKVNRTEAQKARAPIDRLSTQPPMS